MTSTRGLILMRPPNASLVSTDPVVDHPSAAVVGVSIVGIVVVGEVVSKGTSVDVCSLYGISTDSGSELIVGQVLSRYHHVLSV